MADHLQPRLVAQEPLRERHEQVRLTGARLREDEERRVERLRPRRWRRPSVDLRPSQPRLRQHELRQMMELEMTLQQRRAREPLRVRCCGALGRPERARERCRERERCSWSSYGLLRGLRPKPRQRSARILLDDRRGLFVSQLPSRGRRRERIDHARRRDSLDGFGSRRLPVPRRRWLGRVPLADQSP